MLLTLAKIFGAAAIVFFTLALMNFALKWTYRNYPNYFKKHPKYAKVHLSLMKPFVKMRVSPPILVAEEDKRQAYDPVAGAKEAFAS